MGQSVPRCRGRRAGPGSRGSERPAGTAARLFSASPPWSAEVGRGQTLEQGAMGRVEVPQATRWSARGRALSWVQAWKAATSAAWSIRPV